MIMLVGVVVTTICFLWMIWLAKQSLWFALGVLSGLMATYGVGYSVGHLHGEKRGLFEMSNIYEKKMRALAEAFKSETRNWKSEKKTYDGLCSDLECYIATLEDRIKECQTKLNSLQSLSID